MSHASEPVEEPTSNFDTAGTAPNAPVSRSPRRYLPWLLFLATCVSTYKIGGIDYAVPLMAILTAHEMGHFLQAKRYGVPASFPYFIPFPVPPIGTMGAVIAMAPGVGDRRALFDIGISGPLAGLGPALLCCVVGLQLSTVEAVEGGQIGFRLGEPLLFQWLIQLVIGPIGENQDVMLHPLGYAGWVGLFITSLNLFPIGQLDGGHVLYALLRKRAHPAATFVFGAAAVAVIVSGEIGWSLMLIFLAATGLRHPPTADDNVPLGTGRIVLGWLTLLFLPFGFTPTPFKF